MSRRGQTPIRNRSGIVLAMTVVVVLAGMVSFVAVAPVSAAPTTINSCTVIDQPGRYELTQDITDSPEEVCIDIRASDVIFDGNGHTIDGVDSSDTIGVYGNGTDGALTNVTVTNVIVTDWDSSIKYEFVNGGNVTDSEVRDRNGFGILLDTSNGIRIADNTVRVISPSTGIVIVRSDNNIVIDNTIDAIGGISVGDEANGNSIIENSITASEGIVVGGTDTTVTNNTIIGSQTGIILNGDSNDVRNNDLLNNEVGILATSTAIDNNLTGNLIEGSAEDGIVLNGATGSTLVNNTVTSSAGDGIVLNRATGSSLVNNTVTNNGRHGIYLVNSTGNSLMNNNASANVVTGIVLDSQSDNNTLSNNTANDNGDVGFNITSDNNTVSDNIANDNYLDGFEVYGSNNKLSGNNATGNNNGFEVWGSNNTLTHNTATDNLDGFTIYGSSNTLTHNTASGHSDAGFILFGSNNTLKNNTATGNPSDGIMIDGADNNTVAHNTITANGLAGIALSDDAANNLIYDNFLENDNNVRFYSFDGSENTWNVSHKPGPNVIGGPTLGGNYYAKPGAAKGYSEQCADANGDGFCDQPYDLGAPNNTDYLPLTQPSTAPPSEPDVAVSSTSLTFGSVQVGKSTTKTVTVTNKGTAPLQVSATTLGGSNAGAFGVSNGGSFSLAPGDSRTLTVEFAPTSDGTKSATLSIQSDDPDEATVTVSLSGTGASAGPQNKIDSCIVIKQSGRYELTKDITDSTADVCIDIRASNVVFDGNGHTIDGVDDIITIGVYGNGTGGLLSNVTVTNVRVTDWTYGIRYEMVTSSSITDSVATDNNDGIKLDSVSDSTVENNTASANEFEGIEIDDSSDNTLTDNTASANGRYGIELRDSNNNTLTGNNASENDDGGIYLFDSSDNTLTDNTASNNAEYGIYLVASSDNVFIGNTANGNGDDGFGTGFAGPSLNNTFIDNEANDNAGAGFHLDGFSSNSTLRNNTATGNNESGIELENSNNNTLISNTASANRFDGILLVGATNNDLIGNTAQNNGRHGIKLSDSTNNHLTGNVASDNDGSGIVLSTGSTDNTVTKNTASGNDVMGITIYDGSNGNTLVDNTATNNSESGFRISVSENITLENNTASANDAYGIYLNSAHNNTLTHNTVTENIDGGIALSGDAADNLIYDNYLENDDNVVFEHFDGTENTWNVSRKPGPNIIGGPTLGGNYYAKPGGTKGYSERCADTNGDGFCDQPYALGAPNNTDYLPLTKPSGAPPAVPDINVTPASLTFGSVQVGDSATKTVIITNEGNATLNVSATTLGGPDAGAFSVSNGGSFSLLPGDSRTLTVKFAPTSDGAKSATLSIQSNDPDEATVSVSLSGTGVEQQPPEEQPPEEQPPEEQPPEEQPPEEEVPPEQEVPPEEETPPEEAPPEEATPPKEEAPPEEQPTPEQEMPAEEPPKKEPPKEQPPEEDAPPEEEVPSQKEVPPEQETLPEVEPPEHPPQEEPPEKPPEREAPPDQHEPSEDEAPPEKEAPPEEEAPPDQHEPSQEVASPEEPSQEASEGEIPPDDEDAPPEEAPPSEPTVVYYQIDFVADKPLEQLSTGDDVYTSEELIRFAHGSTEEPIMRRSEGEFTTNATLARCLDTTPIRVANSTALVNITVSEECGPVVLSLVSYTKPGPGWSPEMEHLQEFVDADSRTLAPGESATFTVSLPDTSTTQNETRHGSSAESISVPATKPASTTNAAEMGTGAGSSMTAIGTSTDHEQASQPHAESPSRPQTNSATQRYSAVCTMDSGNITSGSDASADASVSSEMGPNFGMRSWLATLVALAVLSVTVVWRWRR